MILSAETEFDLSPPCRNCRSWPLNVFSGRCTVETVEIPRNLPSVVPRSVSTRSTSGVLRPRPQRHTRTSTKRAVWVVLWPIDPWSESRSGDRWAGESSSIPVAPLGCCPPRILYVSFHYLILDKYNIISTVRIPRFRSESVTAFGIAIEPVEMGRQAGHRGLHTDVAGSESIRMGVRVLVAR